MSKDTDSGVMGFLRGIPVVGAFLKGADGGAVSTEFGAVGAVIALVTVHAAGMTLPLAIALAGAGIGAGLYALARSNAKAVAVILGLGLALGASGCATMDRTFAAAHGILGIAEGAYEDGKSVLEETGFVKQKPAPAADAAPTPEKP